MKTPPLPEEIQSAMQHYEPTSRTTLLKVRALVFEAANENPSIGPITETLKWGQPSYLTENTKSGSTVRLGETGGDKHPAIFVNCKTTLIAQFKEHYGDQFDYIGVRALVLTDVGKMSAEIKHCLAMILTYHSRK